MSEATTKIVETTKPPTVTSTAPVTTTIHPLNTTTVGVVTGPPTTTTTIIPQPVVNATTVIPTVTTASTSIVTTTIGPITKTLPGTTTVATTYLSSTEKIVTTILATTSLPTTSTTPCYCIWNGTSHEPGDMLYNVTDSAGWCFVAYCNSSCKVETQSSPCPTQPPTGTTTVSVSGTPSQPKDCIYMNQTMQNKETMMIDNCTIAICENGTTVIKKLYTCPQEEPLICTNGHKAVKVYDENTCCYHYECECVCTVLNKVQYITFDGKSYYFQQYCNFYLVKEITDKYNLTIMVDNQVCDPIDSSFCPQAVVVYFQSYKIVLTKIKDVGNGVYLNDKRMYPAWSNSELLFTSTDVAVTLEIPAIRTKVDYSLTSFSIYLPNDLFGGNTEGQCGTCDNSQFNDCRSPNGIVGNCSANAGQWVVPGAPCVVPTQPSPITTTPETTAVTTQLPCRPAICDLLTSSLFESCNSVISPAVFVASCRSDICNSGNFTCSSLEAYASECSNKGICIDWRNATNGLCEHKCPDNKVYKACGPAVEKTCNYRYNNLYHAGSAPHTNDTKEGCFCPEGTTLFNQVYETCVSSCDCTGPDGKPKMPGETWTSGCKTCVCDKDSMSVECDLIPCQTMLIPDCSEPGYKLVTKTDGCCSQYSCECDANMCPIPMTCPLGFELTYTNGTCCKSYKCEPKGVCVYEGTEYMEGQKIPTPGSPLETTTTSSPTLSGTTAGAGQPSGTTAGAGQPSGTTAGAGQPSGMTAGAGQPSGTTAGAGQPSGTTAGAGQPSGTTAGAGQPSGTTAGAGQPSGTTAGAGQPSGTTAGAGQPSGTTAGAGQPSVTTAGAGQPSVTTAGAGQPSGTTAGAGQPSGTTAGAGQPSGTTAGPGQPSGTTAGAGQPSGTTAGAGQPSGTTAGAGQPSGTTAGAGQPSGTTAGAGQPSGTTAGAGQPSGTTAGAGQPSGTTAGAGQPSGTTAGAGQPSGTTAGPGQPSGTTAGAGQPSGTTAGAGQPSGTTAGAGQPSGTTAGAGQPSGTTAGAGQPSGTTAGAGQPSGTTAGAGQPSGTTAGAGQLSGTTAGAGQPSVPGPCQECFCGPKMDPISKLQIIHCTPIVCNRTCSEGFEYQEVPDQCCGKCVQKSCFLVAPDNTTHIVEINQTFSLPDNKCVQFACENINGQLVTKEIKTVCPTFNPSDCEPGTETTDANGCCRTCKLRSVCEILSKQEVIKVNECKSPRPVNMTYCAGHCGSMSMYSAAAKTMTHQCECCQEATTSEGQVDLECADGTKIPHKYIKVESCLCNRTECVDALIKRRRRR
nr:intestinal mucin-like protein [Labrus bergylta]